MEGYQAVVVGSAVHRGQWLPEAVEFVKTNQEALGHMPVALFCVHITNRGRTNRAEGIAWPTWTPSARSSSRCRRSSSRAGLTGAAPPFSFRG